MKWQILLLLFLLVIPTLTTLVAAVEFNGPTAQEQATFDKILEPVMRIYNLVKYAATAIGTLVLLFAGIGYMTSGGDPKKKETAKNMATYVVIGLVIIWIAPLVVNLLTA